MYMRCFRGFWMIKRGDYAWQKLVVFYWSCMSLVGERKKIQVFDVGLQNPVINQGLGASHSWRWKPSDYKPEPRRVNTLVDIKSREIQFSVKIAFHVFKLHVSRRIEIAIADGIPDDTRACLQS